jgi:hypothetical protein
MTEELRTLAEICASKDPLLENDLNFEGQSFGTGWVRDQRRFILAASPSAVLALLDRIEELEASNRYKYGDGYEAAGIALIGERDQWRQAAELNMQDYQKMYRERDEARAAVKRLAGALVNMLDDCDRMDKIATSEVMADPVVRRIVEG